MFRCLSQHGWCGGNGGGGARNRRVRGPRSLSRYRRSPRISGGLAGFAARQDARWGEGGRTVAQAARGWGLSWPVVHAAFLDHATAVLPEEPEPVVALESMRPAGESLASS